MKKRMLVRRLGTFLCALAISAFMWGCGTDTITGVDQREAPLQTAENDGPPTDGGNDGWW